MKIFLYPIAAFFAGICAQDINSLPECERTCIQNMLTEGPAYGCPNIDNGSPAPDCLCSKPEFAYGVRDCSTQSCPSGTDVNQVNQYGLQYCQSAQASASGTALAAIALFSSGVSSGGGSSSSSETSSSSSSRQPITTIPVISTVTSDGSTMETTLGSSTIYSGETLSSAGGANVTASANQTAVTTEPLVSTVSDSSTTRQTTVGSTTVFSTSTSAGAGATKAAPRLVPIFPKQPMDSIFSWIGPAALTCFFFAGMVVQLG
ncbi:hypothetical protein N0V93_005191 [Gnomoniopsis smithogilvyi]|uniref:CFEM domain-containing protein n=1 Tax=Gnomoniopsis smithogilvyi TaxID=1191159 RepID=A0A9W8YW38_9PEZI|nr:hypothetical protein N0V93_005191 [Gnomoniopsis smithogilvyi]